MADGFWEGEVAARASRLACTMTHRYFLKKTNKCAVFSGSTYPLLSEEKLSGSEQRRAKVSEVVRAYTEEGVDER